MQDGHTEQVWVLGRVMGQPHSLVTCDKGPPSSTAWFAPYVGMCDVLRAPVRVSAIKLYAFCDGLGSNLEMHRLLAMFMGDGRNLVHA